MPNGDRLVTPRVLARTVLVTRNVVAVLEGYTLEQTGEEEEEEIDEFTNQFGNSFVVTKETTTATLLGTRRFQMRPLPTTREIRGKHGVSEEPRARRENFAHLS
jgi:hypothetical protein